jgi:non-heme Fe2+,alpha-ketoglutarate-dependent halogenase
MKSISQTGDINVEDSDKLTQQQLQQFNQDGFLGPFDSPLNSDMLDDMAKSCSAVINEQPDHPMYGRYSVRDWHLIHPQLTELVSHPNVLSKLNQILGEDLLLWRSKIFHKRPGDGAIEWHQEWGAFNGEEIGNDKPGLLPKESSRDKFWNLTIWVALQDVTMDMGPLQLIKGSYQQRYPIDMIPMTESAFWSDPFLDIDNKQTLISKCRASTLVLDIDTSTLLDDVDVEQLSMAQLKVYILEKFEQFKAAITLEFDVKDTHLATVPVKKGQYIIFPERTMHRSTANTSDNERLAINFRVTNTDTLVYPMRLNEDFVDGSNINIGEHRNILLTGQCLEPRNVY